MPAWTEPIEFYEIPYDGTALSLTEKAGLIEGSGTKTRVPIDSLVATEEEVVAEAVSEYKRTRKWSQRPIDVVQRGGRYLILDGHHRSAAAADSGVESIPAIVL